MIEEPKYRFVLVNDQTGESFDLRTEFVPDEPDADGNWPCPLSSCPDVWSSDSAHAEALEHLGYSVKVVKNDQE
jgi:hypothetical protein